MRDAKNDRMRFSELLPFFVNGTLQAEEHQWVLHYMARNPETQLEHKFIELLSDTTKRTQSEIPESERLARLLSQWQQSRPSAAWFKTVWRWLKGRVGVPAAVMASVTVLVVGQAIVIGALVSAEAEKETYRGDQPECVATTSIRVLFNPDATHVDILVLLRKLEATIQNGPSDTGELWLTVPIGQSLEEAQAMLSSSALVDDAAITKESRLPAWCHK